MKTQAFPYQEIAPNTYEIGELTDKPLMVCYTHNHIDHVGGAGAFDNAHIGVEFDFYS